MPRTWLGAQMDDPVWRTLPSVAVDSMDSILKSNKETQRCWKVGLPKSLWSELGRVKFVELLDQPRSRGPSRPVALSPASTLEKP